MIWMLYGHGAQWLAKDSQYLLNHLIEVYVTKSLNFKLQWLDSVQAVIQHQNAHEFGQYIGEHNSSGNGKLGLEGVCMQTWLATCSIWIKII